MRDIRTLDLNLLKALDALLDERSVTRAAARLALTQPAVSGMLARLRESFSDPLFIRTQHGMVPTARALELATPVKQVMADIDTLLQPNEFDPMAARFTLSISATDFALRVVVVPFLDALRQRAPGIRVSVRLVDDDRVQLQLERGELDLALMTPQTAPPDLHARTLFDEQYVCVLREGHPAASGPLTLDCFCALDHALVSYAGGGFWGATDQVLAVKGRERRVGMSVASFLALPDILRVTDMMAVVPRRLVKGLPGLVTQEPPIEIPGFTKLAVWHGRTHHDPAQRWIRALLFEVCERFL